MIRTRRVAACAAIALSLVSPAGAQSPSPAPAPRIDQEVFVTASVAAVPTASLTRTVALVTREALEQAGITSVVDGLRLVPGLDPRARGPKSVQTDFSIRGSTFGQNLILVDGLRLNNSQSGHHNGEIPVALEAVDRIEVVYGAGSAVHGADALGGTINVISRRGEYASVSTEFGEFGYAAVQGAISGHVLPDNWAATGWASRSSGFMFDRDFAQGGASVRGTVAGAVTIDVRHQRRAFGANGFYGPSPSKEWTDQTMAAVTWQHVSARWVTTLRGLARDHHDHFRWDINRPGFAENRHHTNAAEVDVAFARDLGGGRRATVGASGGGDWITSTNLNDHRYSKAGIFGELLVPLGANATMQGGLRFDTYSMFGDSVSPSLSMAGHLHRTLRVHAGVSHAFRVPTFTELYYTDPANIGSPDLVPERGWSLDAGVDWSREGWTLSFSPFRRWDEDVIDWVKAAPPDVWRSTNVRDVTSTGFEASVARQWRGALLRAYYAGLTVDAPSLDLMSKYVLEYVPHQSGASVSLPLGAGFRLALNVDHRNRFDGQEYDLISLRFSRTLKRGELFVDGTNLLDETYQEVAGVAMPGRWLTVGVAIR